MTSPSARLQVFLSIEGARLARLTADAGGLAAFWAELRALAPHARAVSTREELNDVEEGAVCLLLLPPKDAVWLNLSRRLMFDRRLCVILWHPGVEVSVWENLAPDLLSVATTRFIKDELPARILEIRADLERRSQSGHVLVAWDGVDPARVWPDAPLLDPRRGHRELVERAGGMPVRRWSTPVSYDDLERLVRAERAVGIGLGVVTGPMPERLPWPTVRARALNPRAEIHKRGAEAALETGFLDLQYPERGSQTEMRADVVVEAEEEERAVAGAWPDVDHYMETPPTNWVGWVLSLPVFAFLGRQAFTAYMVWWNPTTAELARYPSWEFCWFASPIVVPAVIVLSLVWRDLRRRWLRAKAQQAWLGRRFREAAEAAAGAGWFALAARSWLDAGEPELAVRWALKAQHRLFLVEALGATDPRAALREAGDLDPTHPGNIRSSPMLVRLHDRVGASDRALELVNQVLQGKPPPAVATELVDLAVAIHLRRNDFPAAIALVERALPLVEPNARERLELARKGWESALASARAAAAN
jgi:hypothetical protein